MLSDTLGSCTMTEKTHALDDVKHVSWRRESRGYPKTDWPRD